MDYELEFGIVTKKGANISAANAKNHIFGYTIFNDFSARDHNIAAVETLALGRTQPPLHFDALGRRSL